MGARPVKGSRSGYDMLRRVGKLAPLLLWPLAAQAGSINDQLMKLDPEERAHQVCVIKGIDTIRREGKLPKADRLKTSITGRAAYTGTQVATKGGAVSRQVALVRVAVQMRRDARSDEGAHIHL